MSTTDGPRRLRGRVIAVFLGVAIVAFAVVGVMVATQDRLQAELQGWDIADNGVLPVRVELYRPADTAVSCSIIARDYRQLIVGQTELDVAAGPDEHVLVSVDVPLQGEGIAPEIQGCELNE